MKAYIEAIQEGVCEDMSSVMDYLEVMHTNTEKMARLPEDLLKLSHLVYQLLPQ